MSEAVATEQRAFQDASSKVDKLYSIAGHLTTIKSNKTNASMVQNRKNMNVSVKQQQTPPNTMLHRLRQTQMTVLPLPACE